MKKLFFALLFFTAVGAGVLVWLISTVPSDKKVDSVVHGVKHEDAKNAEPKHAAPHEGVKIVEKEEKPAETEGLPPAPDKRLSIDSEPVRALVYVDGAAVGETPVEVPLKVAPQKVQLIASGFRDFTRQTPTVSEDVKDLSWKVLLKKEERGARGAVSHLLLKGKVNGAFVQVKSIDATEAKESDIKAQVQGLRREWNMDNVVACKVKLPGKGEWTRILAGPYASKSQAARALEALKNEHKTAGILVGAQECQL